MSYLVLARKWRPRSFETLVGQDHVVRALTNALDTQRLHHAWLFTGTRGVGKTTLSRILAKSLNCETGITSKPCGVCRACVEIDEGRFVDYLEFDAASNRRVEEMTQLLEQAVYAPSSGRYKIYMIDEVHMLSGHAFNAMLKTLEEPPPHIKFILATTDPQKMPVTVLSRCLQFNLKQMPPDAIVSHLNHVLTEEGINFEIPGLRQIAQAASGSMRDALSLTDQAIAFSGSNITGDAIRDMLGTIDQRFLVRLLDSLNQGSAQGVLDIANELYERGYSFAGALADLAVLLSQIAIEQRLPGSALTEAVLQEDIVRLARTCHPDTLQLFYSIAVHGRNELALSPDEYAGFVMTCLRMLSLITSEPAHSTASEWHSGNGSASHKAPAAASAKAEAHGDSHSSIPAEQGGSALQGQEESDASASGNAGTTGRQKKNLNDVAGAQVTSRAEAMAGSTQSIAADVDSAATATVSAVSEGDASASQSDRTSHSRLDESVDSVVDESADFDPDVSHVGGSQANESFNPQSSSGAPHVIASDIDTREPVARENALPVKLAPQREPILVPPLQSTAKSANERPAWEEEPGNAECAETQLAEMSQPRHDNVKSDNFNRENISTGETRETGESSSGPPVWEDIPPDWEAAGLTGQTDEDGDIVPVDNMPGDMDQTWVPAHDDPQARRPLSAMNAREWVQLVAELPLNGYAAEMARRCEWMGHQRNKITLRIPVKGQNDLNSKIKLETALSEYFHEVVRVDMVFGQTGDDTLHAVEQAEREALQKRVEKAVQENEFINTLIADLGARIVPGSIEPFSQKSS